MTQYPTLGFSELLVLIIIMMFGLPMTGSDNPQKSGKLDAAKRLPKSYTIPIVDISDDASRQVVVAQGTEKIYQGHPHTLLMPDGKTIYCVWTIGHGGPCGPMKKSLDAGRTWSGLLKTPENWKTIHNCPTIHRLTDPSGVSRLFVFAGNGQMVQSVSEDEGKTWSPMTPNGLHTVVAPMSIMPIEGGRKLMMWYQHGDDNGKASAISVWRSVSSDGGLTWGDTRAVCLLENALPCEPAAIRSPDGKQILVLMRENSRVYNSLFVTSDDEGKTWSKPKELTASLTGDRHNAVYAPDGRLVVVFRDMAAESPTYGSYCAWVGRYEDIIAGREGEYRVELLHQYTRSDWPKSMAWLNHAGKVDCGYSGLELLKDGTFVATTYVKYRQGPEMNSVVSTRFKLSELDEKLKQR